MKRIGLLILGLAAVILTFAVMSCSKDRVIIGFWQQASDRITYVDSLGVEKVINMTDSAVTLNFMDNDSVYLSYGEMNPLLSIPPYLLTDSLRIVIASLPNNLTRDTLSYSLTETTLTIGSQEYQLDKLKGRWLILSTTDSLDGKAASREIKFYKPRK